MWNAWSASGDVTGELVYVNYGREVDYQLLPHVNFTGKIVIARYGHLFRYENSLKIHELNYFRGNKARIAEDKGAIGIVIYSDPADDGFVRGEEYPKGKWRPSSSAQVLPFTVYL